MTFNLKSEAGAPVKHKWLREMKIGDVFNIPESFKINTVRCMVSNYALDEDKKFSVSRPNRTVTRIK